MYAPQIKALASFVRSWESGSKLDAPSRAKLDELFAVLDRFEPVVDDNLSLVRWQPCPPPRLRPFP